MRPIPLLVAILLLAVASWPALAQERTGPGSPAHLISANGGGHIRLDGAPNLFDFAVHSHPDGSVTGQATLGDPAHDREATRWAIDGVVVRDDVAYVCGINVSIDVADPWVGTRWVFAAVDNGTDKHAGPDQLSLPRGPVLLPCDHPEFRPPSGSAALHDVKAGDIKVHHLPVP